MPIREYECQDCGCKFERLELHKDDTPTFCQKCNSKNIKRVISKNTFHLKGNGWTSSLQEKSMDKYKKNL